MIAFHLTLYLLGCDIKICMSINFFSIFMNLPRFMNLFASNCQKDLFQVWLLADWGPTLHQPAPSEADWLTCSNIGTGIRPPQCTRPLVKFTVPSAREIALKFDDQFSTRFCDLVNVASPPSLALFITPFSWNTGFRYYQYTVSYCDYMIYHDQFHDSELLYSMLYIYDIIVSLSLLALSVTS
jgi:hypothetical protein